MEVYFDNAATTRIDENIEKEINNINHILYGNPSAMHRAGYLAEEKVKEASEIISNIINCDKSEIIWTSGGTESNNLAIRGYVSAYKKTANRIITTSIEHPSVYKVFKMLENEGLDVVYLDVDSDGHINLEHLNDLIDERTLLVSIMYVNNEIGSVQKINEIGNIIKNKNNKCAFHVDFVQGFSKYRIDVKKSKIDFLSISSHKFYGPKGVGVLYRNKNIRLNPLIVGGSQQNDLRAGTLNVPGIVGTGVAASMAYKTIDAEFERLKNLKDYLITKLLEINKIYDIIVINSSCDDGFAPHIISITFKGIRSEVLLHALEEKGIYVSAGSACSSHDKKISRTLNSIGLKNEMAQNTIRISFGKYNTKEEIDFFIEEISKLIPKLCISQKFNKK